MSDYDANFISLVFDFLTLGLGGLTFIALLIYVWKTWEMAKATREAVEASRETLEEIREGRKQENAPYVIAFFDVPSSEGMRSLEFVIRNIGKTFATDVRISFDPPFESHYQEMFDRVFPVAGIPAMAPGYEIRTALSFFEEYKTSGKSMQFEVSVEYGSVLDDGVRRLSYRQDLMIYRGTMTITSEYSEVRMI